MSVCLHEVGGQAIYSKKGMPGLAHESEKAQPVCLKYNICFLNVENFTFTVL